MKIGDLVSYGPWYKGSTRYGLIVEGEDPYFFVIWNNDIPEWEDKCELREVVCRPTGEVINELGT